MCAKIETEKKTEMENQMIILFFHQVNEAIFYRPTYERK